MIYRVIIEKRCVKEIESLPGDILQGVMDVIEGLKSGPRPHNTKKLAGVDCWRIKIRTYRILYTIDDKQRLVTIYRVKHRRDAYR